MASEINSNNRNFCVCMRTHLLIAAIILLSIYSFFFENAVEIDIEDYIDLTALEQDVDCANPVHHLDYVSPINESLFVDQNIKDDWYSNHRNCRNRSEYQILKYKRIWHKANRLIAKDSLHPDNESETAAILTALHSACIIKTEILDIGKYESGSSEKWLITLEGDQKALVKIVWEQKGEMKKGGLCNTGFEMATSEIAAFHLHEILDFRNTPYVVGRQINLKEEILPTASEDIKRKIIIKDENQLCLTGMCYDCHSMRHICPEKNIVEASITLWISKTIQQHTFPQLYMPFSTTRIEKWANKTLGDRSYCNEVKETIQPYNLRRMYLHLFDFAAVDMIMYHFDSKHYTIQDGGVADGTTVRLDHGRAFCTYDREDDDIFLAPIKQCCTIRSKTYYTLVKLQAGRLSLKLRMRLQNDPIAPILKPGWFYVIDQRLKRILETLEKCFEKFGVNDVLVDDN